MIVKTYIATVFVGDEPEPQEIEYERYDGVDPKDDGDLAEYLDEEYGKDNWELYGVVEKSDA